MGSPIHPVPQSDYIRAIHEKWGDRLIIHPKADGNEIEDNVRAAEALLNSFPDMRITIREHLIINHHKNPEYEIDGKIGDRKGIKGHKGVANAFLSAKEQGCSVVVIDFDKRMKKNYLPTIKLSGSLFNRQQDFRNGNISECYVVYKGRAVLVDKKTFTFGNEVKSTLAIQKVLESIA